MSSPGGARMIINAPAIAASKAQTITTINAPRCQSGTPNAADAASTALANNTASEDHHIVSRGPATGGGGTKLIETMNSAATIAKARNARARFRAKASRSARTTATT